MGLILEDAAVSIRIGDNFVGDTPEFTGTAINFSASAKSVEYKKMTEKANVAGASGKKAHRYHSDEETLTLKGVVPTAGVLFGAVSPVRKNIEVTYLPNSTLELERVWVGVCTSWEHSATQGDATVETIEIDLSADYSPGA